MMEALLAYPIIAILIHIGLRYSGARWPSLGIDSEIEWIFPVIWPLVAALSPIILTVILIQIVGNTAAGSGERAELRGRAEKSKEPGQLSIVQGGELSDPKEERVS